LFSLVVIVNKFKDSQVQLINPFYLLLRIVYFPPPLLQSKAKIGQKSHEKEKEEGLQIGFHHRLLVDFLVEKHEGENAEHRVSKSFNDS